MRRFWEYPDSCVSLSRSSLPQALLTPSQRTCPSPLPFDIRHPLRRAVRLAVEPEDLRGINAIDTRQRVIAVLVAVDVGQRHVSVQLLQQAEPFPDKPGSDRLAGWLSAQHLAARFADAASEPRVVPIVPARLAVTLLHGDGRGCHNASGGTSGAAKDIAGKDVPTMQATRRSYSLVLVSSPCVQKGKITSLKISM